MGVPADGFDALHDLTYLLQADPIAFAIGPLKIHWYGLMYLLGFGVAWWLGRQRIRAGRLPGVDEHGYGDLMFYAMVGVVLGGRLGYILFYDLHTYLAHPLQMLKVWEGGMSFHGGLIGVSLAIALFAWRNRLDLLKVGDIVAQAVPIPFIDRHCGSFAGGSQRGSGSIVERGSDRNRAE